MSQQKDEQVKQEVNAIISNLNRTADVVNGLFIAKKMGTEEFFKAYEEYVKAYQALLDALKKEYSDAMLKAELNGAKRKIDNLMEKVYQQADSAAENEKPASAKMSPGGKELKTVIDYESKIKSALGGDSKKYDIRPDTEGAFIREKEKGTKQFTVNRDELKSHVNLKNQEALTDDMLKVAISLYGSRINFYSNDKAEREYILARAQVMNENAGKEVIHIEMYDSESAYKVARQKALEAKPAVAAVSGAETPKNEDNIPDNPARKKTISENAADKKLGEEGNKPHDDDKTQRSKY